MLRGRPSFLCQRGEVLWKICHSAILIPVIAMSTSSHIALKGALLASQKNDPNALFACSSGSVWGLEGNHQAKPILVCLFAVWLEGKPNGSHTFIYCFGGPYERHTHMKFGRLQEGLCPQPSFPYFVCHDPCAKDLFFL